MYRVDILHESHKKRNFFVLLIILLMDCIKCAKYLRCTMLWKKVSRWRSSLRSKVDSCDKIEHCAMQLQCNAMLPKVLWLALQLCNAMHCLAMLAKVFWFLLQLCMCNATAQWTAVQRSATLAKVLWLPPITAHCFRPQWATPIRLCFNANQSTADQCNVSVQCIRT